MGKNLSKRERTIILAKEILQEFSKGKKLSALLQMAAEMARLADDSYNQKWIDKEISGNFFPNDQQDMLIMLLHRRVGASGNYLLEHIEVSEASIDSQRLRLKATKDPNISVQTANPYQNIRNPQGNWYERDQIVKSINGCQAVISAIKGRLYKYVLDTFHTLNFSEIATDILSKIRKNVELKLKILSPESLTELAAAHDSLSSRKHPDWSNVASCCRRILIQIADKVYPPTNIKVKIRSGDKVKLDNEHYRLRIKEFLKGRKTEEVIARDTSEYLFELLDSVDRLNAKADKNIITRDTAEKIFIYTYLLLHDILAQVPKVDSEKNRIPKPSHIKPTNGSPQYLHKSINQPLR